MKNKILPFYSKNRKKIELIVSFLFFVIIPFIFFWRFFIQGMIPVPPGILNRFLPLETKEKIANPLISDVILQIYPFKSIVFEGWRNFEVYFWNPYLFAGESFVANVQPGYFYPLNFFSFFFNDQVSFSLLVFSQLILGGIFAYIFFRELGLKKISSYFGSMAFIFSGPFAVWLEWGTMGSTFLWLPLVLFFFLRLVKKSSLGNFFGAGFALGMSSLAGHFQILLYVWGMSFVFGFFVNFFSKISWSRKVLNVFVPFFLALIIGFVQIYPSLKASSSTFRPGVDNYHNLPYYPVANLVTLMMPNFFGSPAVGDFWGEINYNELAVYSGVIVLCLMIFSLIYFRNRFVAFFWTSLAVVFLSIIGTPLYWVFFKIVPPLDKLPPIRIACLFSFLIIVLASFALDRLFLQEKKEEILLNKKKFFSGFILTLVVFGICIFLFPDFFKSELIEDKYNEYFDKNFFQATFLTILSLSSIALALFLKKSKKFLAIVLLVVSTLDVFYFSYSYNPFTLAQNVYPKNVDFVNFLKQDKDIFRVHSQYAGGNDILMKYKIQIVDGYDSMYPMQYLNFMRASSENIVRENSLEAEKIYPEILDLLNVKYVVLKKNKKGDASGEFIGDSWKEAYSSEKYLIMENKDFLPRFFLVNKCFSEDDAAVLEKIKARKINFREEAYIEAGKENICEKIGDGVSRDDGLGTVTINNYTPDRVLIDCNINKNSLLVFSDSFHPGWQVFVNGQEEEILRTNYNFRGVYLEKGNYSLEFKYSPF